MAAAGGAGVSMYSSVPLAPAPPERQLAYTAAFSRLATVKQVSEFLCSALGLAREDMRLWSVGNVAVLLDDERPTLQQLGLDERTSLLIELRNNDLTWPEEITQLSMSASGCRATERRETLIAPNLPGATGLHNLGNTCFMNAALQSVWNTGPLTRYFNSGMHLYEVNTNNPLGTKGALALRYGELCKEVWSCSARSVAPLRVRWCVSRHARGLAGGGQHDAQELLAWLLDTLHEDLNRAIPPTPKPHRDSDGRPDQIVAAEAWEAHTARNKSIITDLFYGQLKSKVCCDTCGRDSVRFDAFNMLSLPLPMESYVRCEVRVMLLDGSVPVKYGVRVNSEGTYLDLKKRLKDLCGLEPESMLLTELNGALIGRVMDDSMKISASSAGSLYAYEIPNEDSGDLDDLSDGDDLAQPSNECVENECLPSEAAEAAEVSVGRGRRPRGASPSLCMPALFCFKRSKSEILMSQSPPNSFSSQTSEPNGYRFNTLPKDLKRMETNGNASPTLSVKSLNLKPPCSPRLGRVKFGSSPSNMNRMNVHTLDSMPAGNVQYLVAVHRKQCRADAYFLPSQRCKPQLFGVPLLVGLRDGMSGREIYGRVWVQVARLLSARPPQQDQSNHAMDCDDSLGYEYPFTLRLVSGGGAWCAVCAWPALCRGCVLRSDDQQLVTDTGTTPRARKRFSVNRASIDSGVPDCNSPSVKTKLQHQVSRLAANSEEESCVLQRLDFSVLRQIYRRVRSSVMLAIDWDPTALHLRYQSTREKAWTEHPSVSECVSEAARPVDLASCLRAFTSQERLEERYHCARCRSAQPATKKLQIWRAPPILIIHLKRFQYVNNKWIKSQKVVNFPFTDFDPTDYLAAVPQETILRYREISVKRKRSTMVIDEEPISESEEETEEEDQHTKEPKSYPKIDRKRRESADVRTRQRLESTSLAVTPVTDDNLVDYHQHRLQPEQEAFDLKYRLYAVVSHSGQMSGGHYVAYARNPSGAWLCYNDSSCRELTSTRRPPHTDPVPPIDPASAYLLFYERQGLDYESYLPDIDGKEPVVKDSETLDPDESDLKKMCTIM
ncbi:hypothetical protein O0L34_g15208 [Tuta absoluta]|nr:hypothetical protein O0L34_g15208 [Tuta absoluta]